MRLFILLFFIWPVLAVAQDGPLMVEGTAPGLFILHKVVAQENFYSIGRLYNVSPKEIAPFNKIALEKGLTPGQELKIPLSIANFLQAGVPGVDEALVPLYHKVNEKEGLYRISQLHNKVPVESLKLWNKLSSDILNNGSNLIVGYLKVKKDQSVLAEKSTGLTTQINVSKAMTTSEKKVEPVIEKTTAVVKEPLAEKKPEPSVEKLPVSIVPVVDKKTEVVIEKFPETKTEKETEMVNPGIIKGSGTDFNGGVFKSLFDSQFRNNEMVEEAGAAGIFKSTSGWKDGKYYCLHNTAAAGTIIKVTNTANGKFIFAKVLDIMPDLRQNEGLLIRISNAAGDELGVSETGFSCTIKFSK